MGAESSSNPIASKGNYVQGVERVTQWLRIFGAAGADGATVADPRGITGFQATLSKEVHVASGRMLMNRIAKGRLEVLPLLSNSGATIKYQLWGFTFNQNIPSAAAADQSFPYQSSGDAPDGYALSMSYPIPMDQGNAVDEIGASTAITASTLSTVKMSFTKNCEPYYDSTAAAFYVAPRQIFDSAGFYAIMARVTSVSAGTAILLARFI